MKVWLVCCWTFWFSPVTTAPVIPRLIFATIPIHIASFIYPLKAQVRGRTTICGLTKNNNKKMHRNIFKSVSSRKHNNTHAGIQSGCVIWPSDEDQMASLTVQCGSCGTTKALSPHEHGHCPITIPSPVTHQGLIFKYTEPDWIFISLTFISLIKKSPETWYDSNPSKPYGWKEKRYYLCSHFLKK